MVDRQAVSAAALKAVQMAEAEAGIQLESIVVGCGGLRCGAPIHEAEQRRGARGKSNNAM